jgi:hypothetical protein
VVLKRTTPVPWSAVGGVETFHATQPRLDVQGALVADVAHAKSVYQEDLAASRREESMLLREVKTLRSAVMHGGQNARSKYCLHITDQQDDRRKKRSQAVRRPR